MIKADARQKEQELFDKSIKLKLLAFDAKNYQQSIKIREEYQKLYKKQQFYKTLIKLLDYANMEVNDDEQKLLIK